MDKSSPGEDKVQYSRQRDSHLEIPCLVILAF